MYDPVLGGGNVALSANSETDPVWTACALFSLFLAMQKTYAAQAIKAKDITVAPTAIPATAPTLRPLLLGSLPLLLASGIADCEDCEGRMDCVNSPVDWEFVAPGSSGLGLGVDGANADEGCKGKWVSRALLFYL